MWNGRTSIVRGGVPSNTGSRGTGATAVVVLPKMLFISNTLIMWDWGHTHMLRRH